jgi:hypothetical protein
MTIIHAALPALRGCAAQLRPLGIAWVGLRVGVSSSPAGTQSRFGLLEGKVRPAPRQVCQPLTHTRPVISRYNPLARTEFTSSLICEYMPLASGLQCLSVAIEPT